MGSDESMTGQIRRAYQATKRGLASTGRVLAKGATFYTLSSRIARTEANARKFREKADRLRQDIEREERANRKHPLTREQLRAIELLRQSTNHPEMALARTPSERIKVLKIRAEMAAAQAEKAAREASRLRALQIVKGTRKKK